MGYNNPKPGDVIAKWEMAESYMCTESGPSEGGKSKAGTGMGDTDKDRHSVPGNQITQETFNEAGTPQGDNPNYSFDVSLPQEGDTRVKDTSGFSPIFPGRPGMPHQGTPHHG